MKFNKSALALGLCSILNASEDSAKIIDYERYEKPKMYLDLTENSKRYLILRKEFERINLELGLSGRLEYDFQKMDFDYKTFKLDLKLKMEPKR